VRFYIASSKELMLFADLKVIAPKRFSDVFIPDSNQPLSFPDFKAKLWQVQLERLAHSNHR
jgi:hypothetical protein